MLSKGTSSLATQQHCTMVWKVVVQGAVRKSASQLDRSPEKLSNISSPHFWLSLPSFFCRCRSQIWFNMSVAETNLGELPEVSGGLDLQLVLIWFDSMFGSLACEFGDRKNLGPDLYISIYIYTDTHKYDINMTYIVHIWYLYYAYIYILYDIIHINHIIYIYYIYDIYILYIYDIYIYFEYLVIPTCRSSAASSHVDANQPQPSLHPPNHRGVNLDCYKRRGLEPAIWWRESCG